MTDQSAEDPGDAADTVAQFVAQQITPASGAPAIDLAAAISDIVIETAINAASTLTVTVVDPDLVLLTSGLIDTDADGILAKVEVEFPQGSGSFWRLTAVDAKTDTSSPNVTLTFEDRIVSELRDQTGTLKATSGSTTRAQFIRSLAREISAIRFVCPELDRKAAA